MVGDSVQEMAGRLVHLVSRPGPAPVVVLLGGCGVPWYQWVAVVGRLEDCATVSLDRPGLGGTPWPAVMPTLAAEVATLLDLTAEVGKPVVLVAHSMAGPHAEAFARLNPHRVAGLVLVDGSVEWTVRRQRSLTVWLLVAKAVRGLARLRPVALLGQLTDRSLVTLQSHRSVKHPVRPLARRQYRSPDALASVVAEQGAYRQQMYDLAQVRRRCRWPRIPTTVLAATRSGSARWRTSQRRLADLLAAGYREVPDSRHLMMIDNPVAIAEAVLELVRRHRERAPGDRGLI